MSFKPASESAHTELEDRKKTPGKILRFGVNFLDDALRGIFPDDLILLGAASGVGKTQLCSHIAMANMEEGNKVHYLALEASKFEIERRLKYPLVLERYLSDPVRPRFDRKINYADWVSGKYIDRMISYEQDAADFFQKAYSSLFLFYKQERFGLKELIEQVTINASGTDLIIVDHVHYFDFEDDNENRAIREIAKTVRTLALEQQRPIILVAHLRKRDKFNGELVAGMEEFQGSSDLYKIATKVITVAPGPLDTNGNYATYFRIPKNRMDGGATRFLGEETYSPNRGGYLTKPYRLGWAEQKKEHGFEEVQSELYPDWAVRSSVMSGSNNNYPPGTRPTKNQNGTGAVQTVLRTFDAFSTGGIIPNYAPGGKSVPR